MQRGRVPSSVPLLFVCFNLFSLEANYNFAVVFAIHCFFVLGGVVLLVEKEK